MRACGQLAAAGRYGEVEAALSLGLPKRDAHLEAARGAAMLLAGASPVRAAAVQVFVPVALLAVEALSVALTVELVARRRLHRTGVPAGRARGGA